MFKNQYVFIRNAVLVVLVCNTLYWLFPFRPILWRLLLVFFAVYLIVNEKKRLFCEKAVLLFAGFVFLHFLISFIWSIPSLTILGNVLCALLTLELFTCLSEKGVMTERFIAILAFLLVIVAIPYFFHYRVEMLSDFEATGEINADITNNASALFLMLLPILFLLKNPIQQWVSFMVCLFFIILSAKRGNIIAAVIPSLLFAYGALKDNKHSVLKTIAVIVAIVIASFFLFNWAMNNDYLMYRVEQTIEGNSSRRDVIYANAWNAWASAESLFTLLFGYGYMGASVRAGVGPAHSDWLEFLVDFGLFGVLFYLFIFIVFFKQVRRTHAFETRIAMLAALLIWFFKSVYSMGIVANDMLYLMVTLGIALGRYKLNEMSL